MTVWDDLSCEQREAVYHRDGPAAVYAGPGSGKTRVVTLRAVRLALAGCRTLVTTFTADATQEMKARITRLLDADALSRTRVSTVHALCLQLLRANGRRFTLLTDELQRKSLAEVARAGDLEGGVSGFLGRISYLKNTGSSADGYRHDGSSEDVELARAWRAYENEKARKGMVEFDDLVPAAAALLETNEAIRLATAGQFSHIIVDECQDMNSPQYRVVFALGREHRNLMLVGDLDQSLYGFRGADTQTFKRFAAQPKVKVFELRENYRCTRQILAFADSLIRQDANRRQVAFHPTRPDGECVVWERYADPDVEALAIAESAIRRHKNGCAWRDMAVLYRTTAQAEAVERHFAALEIPFSIRDDGDFYGRREIRGVLAYLHFFADTGGSNPGRADEWLLALMNVPDRRISREVGRQLSVMAEISGKRIWDVLPSFHANDLRTHQALRELRQDLDEIERKMGSLAHAGDAIRAVRRTTDLDGWLNREYPGESGAERLQNVQRMQAAASHYGAVQQYLDAVQRVRDEAARRSSESKKKRRERDEVCLSTGHSAKGLEWRCVFTIGWSESILPHARAEDIDEERRIAYVMATRARDALQISSLDSWNDAATGPSRFLTGLNLAAAVRPASEGAHPDDERQPRDEFGGLFLA